MRRRLTFTTISAGLVASPLVLLGSAPSSAQQVIDPSDAENWQYVSMVPSPQNPTVAQAYLAKWHSSNLSGLNNDLVYSMPTSSLINQYTDFHLQVNHSGEASK